MLLDLPDVTLVLIETREHALARLALQECVDRVRFGEVLVFSDQEYPVGRLIRVPDWPDKISWSRCFWYEVPLHVRTSHALGIQWDSWVVDPEMWTDEFLRYDFVGAPWWYKDGMNVGNGGFCLRSSKLMRYVRKHRAKFPCITALDDDLYCRKYRPALEAAGFEWAPEALASRFAFETQRPTPDSRHFGFHACYNFEFGCRGDRDLLLHRAKLMAKSSYVTRNKYMWEGFSKANPEIAEAAIA